MNKRHDTLALSSLYLDINFSHFPFQDGFKVETQTVGTDYSLSPGGSGAVFSQAMAALGRKPLLMGKIGQDESGQLVARLLKNNGVETKLITNTHHTNLSVNFTNPIGKNILTTAGTANQSLTASEIIPLLRQALPDAKMLYLGSLLKFTHLLPHLSELIDTAKTARVITVLDHGRVTNASTSKVISEIKNSIGKVDYYLPSEIEFLTIWNAKTIEDGFKKAAAHAPNLNIIVTKGNQGAIGRDTAGNIHTQAARQLPVINSIGAGDTFNAGFAHALLSGRQISDCLKWGVATAELKISTNTFPSAKLVEEETKKI